MGRPWPARLSFVLLSSLISSVYAGHSFENTAIVRTVELGGSLVHVTTTYAVKALEDDASVYTIALGGLEHDRASYLDAKIKGQSTILPFEAAGHNAQSGVHFFDIHLPKSLSTNATTNLVIDSIETHATYPWPEQASQKDPQSLKYESDLFVLSPYHTAVQRTKFKSPSPQVLFYTNPEGVDEFTSDVPVTKSGATITYGPFHNIPSSSEEFLSEKQKRVTVHYNFDHPVLEIASLKRAAEVSHWGANLNIEDKISLHNAGPALKGHFSRLEYQSSNFFGRAAPHVIPGLTLHLPAGIRSPYYYDLIGNVSTSHLRTAPSGPRSLYGSQYSVFEMRPRYPLLGGWNYSFTLGWDSPLADSAGFDMRTGKYLVGVPVMTPFPGTVVDEAELKVILPEGATDVEFSTPFAPLSSELSTHITYLDTIGRPAVTLRYTNLTGKHIGTVYVSYKVSLAAHLKKPLAVAAAFMSLFVLGFASKRLDIRIQKK